MSAGSERPSRDSMDLAALDAGALRALVESSADGVLIVDASGVVRFCNEAAAVQLQRDRERLEGGEFGVPVVPGLSAVIDVPASDGGAPGICELRSTAITLGGEAAFLVSLRDVTARESARRHAEAVARARAEVLNMVAHELRTPLTVISGYLDLMSDGSLGEVPESWRGPLDKITGKAGELSNLVEQVLLSARLDDGRLRSSRAPTDLREVARLAVRRAAGRSELLQARLRIDLDAAPVSADVDPAQVGVILDNLVNNALTYSTPPADVAVEVRNRSGWAVIAVSDRGRGIAEADRERVFSRFQRSDGADARRPAGAGLGLSIARALAAQSGGDVVLAWSELGSGSRFEVRFPNT